MCGMSIFIVTILTNASMSIEAAFAVMRLFLASSRFCLARLVFNIFSATFLLSSNEALASMYSCGTRCFLLLGDAADWGEPHAFGEAADLGDAPIDAT